MVENVLILPPMHTGRVTITDTLPSSLPVMPGRVSVIALFQGLTPLLRAIV
jgi:hypothetical protein